MVLIAISDDEQKHALQANAFEIRTKRTLRRKSKRLFRAGHRSLHNVLTLIRKFDFRHPLTAFASLLFVRPICISVITVFAYHRENFPELQSKW